MQEISNGFRIETQAVYFHYAIELTPRKRKKSGTTLSYMTIKRGEVKTKVRKSYIPWKCGRN